jgi:hypothetical protein
MKCQAIVTQPADSSAGTRIGATALTETFNPCTRGRAGKLGNAKSRKRRFGFFASEALNALVGGTGIPGASGDCLGKADPKSVEQPIANSGIVCDVGGNQPRAREVA